MANGSSSCRTDTEIMACNFSSESPAASTINTVLQSNPFIRSPSIRSNKKLGTGRLLITENDLSGNFLLLLVEGLLISRFDTIPTVDTKPG